MKANPSEPIEVLAIYKGAERFIFLYRASAVQSLYRALLAAKNDPDSSFDWWDMVYASRRVRRRLREISVEART